MDPTRVYPIVGLLALVTVWSTAAGPYWVP